MEQKFQISLVCDQQVSSYWSSLVATPPKSWNQNQTENQYRVCPPLGAVAALILHWIELTKALTVCIGMLFHSSINAFLSCARVAGGFRRFLTLLSSSSHMCSIGVKSGLYSGHASGAMLLFARKSWQTRATCGRALSCCRIRLRCCTSGTATGRKISSLYLTAVILPATIINCDFIPWAMPPQTITEPPPNRSRSTTQVSAKRSPTSVHTMSTICAIECEPRLVRKKNSSPLPHRK